MRNNSDEKYIYDIIDYLYKYQSDIIDPTTYKDFVNVYSNGACISIAHIDINDHYYDVGYFSKELTFKLKVKYFIGPTGVGYCDIWGISFKRGDVDTGHFLTSYLYTNIIETLHVFYRDFKIESILK